MGDGKKGLKATYIRQAVEDSLRRLQTDYIDIYQAHKDDPETPLEETLEAFDGLVKQGRFGMSARRITAEHFWRRRWRRARSMGSQATSRYSRTTTWWSAMRTRWTCCRWWRNTNWA
jgi:aryl-alcohol dehydrogenase-like predicted oxidoreductase